MDDMTTISWYIIYLLGLLLKKLFPRRTKITFELTTDIPQQSILWISTGHILLRVNRFY